MLFKSQSSDDNNHVEAEADGLLKFCLQNIKLCFNLLTDVLTLIGVSDK